MARQRYRYVKDYDKPYIVEQSFAYEGWGDVASFATKAEAVAYILAQVEKGESPLDFRILTEASFTLTWED